MPLFVQRLIAVVVLLGIVGFACLLGLGKGMFREWLRGLNQTTATSRPNLKASPPDNSLQTQVEQLKEDYYREHIATLQLNKRGFQPLRTPVGNFLVRIEDVWYQEGMMMVTLEIGNPHRVTVKNAQVLMSWQRQGKPSINYAATLDEVQPGDVWSTGFAFKPEYGITATSTVQIALKLSQVQFAQ